MSADRDTNPVTVSGGDRVTSAAKWYEFEWERQGLTRLVIGRVRFVYYRRTWRKVRGRKHYLHVARRGGRLGWIVDVWNLRVIWESRHAW